MLWLQGLPAAAASDLNRQPCGFADTPFLPKLFATHRGAYLQQNLAFMKGKPWVRHDEHYHVDFSVPCKPNAG